MNWNYCVHPPRSGIGNGVPGGFSTVLSRVIGNSHDKGEMMVNAQISNGIHCVTSLFTNVLPGWVHVVSFHADATFTDRSQIVTTHKRHRKYYDICCFTFIKAAHIPRANDQRHVQHIRRRADTG